MRTYRVFIPVYIDPEDTTIDIEIEDDIDDDVLDSEIIRRATEKLIEERPLLPWLVDDTYTIEPSLVRIDIDLIDSDTPQ